MLATSAKTTMRDMFDAIKKANPHLIAHKAATAVAQQAGKKRKKVEINTKRSQEPQLKKATMDTCSMHK